MSPGKPIDQAGGQDALQEKRRAQAQERPQTQGLPQAQGQGLRKLKWLLQRWWQKHSADQSDFRDSYLNCALIFGAAHYLTQLNNGLAASPAHSFEPAPDITFASCVAVVQDLWPSALTGAASTHFFRFQGQSSELVNDSSLQKEFLALTKHRLVKELFLSPLCPSFIYEAFSFRERRTSKDLLQDDRSHVDTCHLISFTQIYTPAWVVDHLLQNTLDQKLSDSADIPALLNTTLLDPALGGGIFLVQALASCMAAYQTFGLTPAEAAKYSLANNLFGLDIDPAALATAALSLILKAFCLGLNKAQVKNLLPLANLCLIEDEAGDQKEFPLGSLCKNLRNIDGHILSKRYDVVVANPPYLGRKLLPRPLKEKLKRYYPDAASDLSQAFLSMALDLAKPGGKVGFITQGSILHLANARCLRERILKEHQLIQVVELGSGVFPFLAGEKASTALIIIRNSRPANDQEGHFLSLVAQSDKSSRLAGASPDSDNRCPAQIDSLEIVRRQSDFLNDQDGVINYMRPQVVINLRSRLPKLADIATLKQGLATTNNARFLRYIWEINPADIGERFVPYARGEGGERWWSPLNTLVLWENNGLAIKEAVKEAYPYLKGNYAWVVKNEDYYFRGGLTFSFVSKDRLAVRKLAAGAIFDVGSSAIFAHNSDQEGTLLAYLNSTLATAMAHDLNPTINFQVGDLKKLVIPNFSPVEQARLSNLAGLCVAAKEKLFTLSSPLRFFQQSKVFSVADSFSGAPSIPEPDPISDTVSISERVSISDPASISDRASVSDRASIAESVSISESSFISTASSRFDSTSIFDSFSITEDSFNLAHSLHIEADKQLRAYEQEIDTLVMLATTRDSNLDERDKRAIENFADRPKQKTNNGLTVAKFCLSGLIEGMLRYFYNADWDKRC
jgi:hypothetical protein